MPSLHKSSTGSHFFIRTSIHRRPMTLQLENGGVEFLRDRGVFDGDDFSPELLRDLEDRGWIFTRGGGLGEEMDDSGERRDGRLDAGSSRRSNRGLARVWRAFADDDDEGELIESAPARARIFQGSRDQRAAEVSRKRSRVILSIRMEAHDHTILDQSAREIIETTRRTETAVFGPIPLPSRVERYQTRHLDHISGIEIRTHKRLIQIDRPTGETIEALNRLSLPSGVQIRIEANGR